MKLETPKNASHVDSFPQNDYVSSNTGSRGVPFERMNKKTTYLFEMHCCVNSPGQKSSFPSQYTFIFAGPLLPNRFLSCEPPLFLNLLTADYCDRSRLKAANVRLLSPFLNLVRSQPLDDCGRSSQRSISSKIMAVRTIEIGSGAVDRRK